MIKRLNGVQLVYKVCRVIGKQNSPSIQGFQDTTISNITYLDYRKVYSYEQQHYVVSDGCIHRTYISNDTFQNH